MDDLFFKNPSMKAPRLTRSYLERLTTYELIRLADGLGMEIPPDLERLFIIAEILDTASEAAPAEAGSEPAQALPLRETHIPEPVPLPRQYNITFIEVLIRDPLWVFTFWEIKSADKECYEKAGDFKGYQLKVSPVDPAGAFQKEDSFTISVGPGDTAWYLGFPPGGGRFQVELCALRGGEALALAASPAFTVPTLFTPSQPKHSGDGPRHDLYTPLARLSGLEDFRILRNEDRRSRMKPLG
ncbi:MAG: DUF4912 domain-containing protein [Treponema sp.]|jgi:hypothetical protein|nr:DUF4912 domain-containing protein [Treponema sp.]